MFNVAQEIGLADFKAWSGGKDRLDRIIELDIVEEAANYIGEFFGFGDEDSTQVIQATTLNDFLWFEMDDFIEKFENEEEATVNS